MRARLLFSYLPGRLFEESGIPPIPPLIIEDGVVGLFVTDWVRVFEGVTLDSLTEADVRHQMRIAENAGIYLPVAREIPDGDLLAPEVTQWRRDWWEEIARSLTAPVAKAA